MTMTIKLGWGELPPKPRHATSSRAYSPALPPELVHRLYLLGKASGKPMTKLLREALEAYLDVREQQPTH